MLFVDNTCQDPRYNLALEEYVFCCKCDTEPVFLLWQNEPSVIVGRYQDTIAEINVGYIDNNNVHVVRRITGGGAVYHDLGNLNYSFMIPHVPKGFDFKSFTKPVIAALLRFGVETEFSGRNDLLVDGKKFSGSAQHYQNGKLLHHGTILFDSNLEHMQNALQVREKKIFSKGIRSVRSRVTNLKPYIAADMSVEDFKKYLLEDFYREYRLRPVQLSVEEQAQIEELVHTKYARRSWNYGNSPRSNIAYSIRTSGGIVEAVLLVERGCIRDLHLQGDFFCTGDLREFESAFTDCPYTLESVRGVLEKLPAESRFMNITSEEMVQLIYRRR